MFELKRSYYYFLQVVEKYILPLLHIQFFIAVCSLPLLSLWGLQFSFMSIIGNIICAPIISIYIATSFFVFITECLMIPNGYLIKILSAVSYTWISILGLIERSMLVAIPKLPILVSISILLIACIILKSKKVPSTLHKIILYALILLSIFCYTKLETQQDHFKLIHENNIVHFFKDKNINYLFLNNTLSQRGSEKFVRFTLLSNLNQCGINELNVVMATGETAQTYNALKILLDLISVKKLCVKFPTTKRKKINDSWIKLQEKAIIKNTQLLEIPKKTQL